MALMLSLWHEVGMTRRTTHAGGFFLVLAIIGGFLWGAMDGMPVFGALVGTAIGVVAALLVWLFDRQRA